MDRFRPALLRAYDTVCACGSCSPWERRFARRGSENEKRAAPGAGVGGSTGVSASGAVLGSSSSGRAKTESAFTAGWE